VPGLQPSAIPYPLLFPGLTALGWPVPGFQPSAKALADASALRS